MKEREALKLALEALKANDLLINGTEKAGGLAWCIDGYYSGCFDINPINEQTERAITAIKEALAKPEQEPVAYEPMWGGGPTNKDYEDAMRARRLSELATPQNNPQRTWVGLTQSEFQQAVEGLEDLEDCWVQIEAALKEKNT